MSSFIRSVLVSLIAVLSAGLAGTAGGACFLPGTIYDQEKHYNDPQFGWSNWYYDPDNSGYQPGHTIDNTIDHLNPPAGWRREADLSCWMATASNMLRYVGGPDMYQTWAYDQGAWSDGLYYWNHGGFPGKALYVAGYPTDEPIDNNGIWSYPQNVIDTIHVNLANAMPVGIAVFNAGMRHAITVVGIDTTNHTMTVTDSDDGLHNITNTFPYTVTGNQVQLGYAGGSAIYGYATFLMLDWWGSGTLGDTATSGPTTLWSNFDNWGGSMFNLTKIQFSNAGLLNADTSVTGLKLLLKGDLTTINVIPGGSLTWEMLQNSGAHVNLTGGTLAVQKDFFHSGTLAIGPDSIFGAGNVYLGSGFSGVGHITQTGGTASMGTIVVGKDAGYSGSTLTVQGGNFSVGDLTVGQSGGGSYDQQSGTVHIANLIAFGIDAGSSGTGTYSGGSLSGEDMVLGNAGTATFAHSGSGTLNIDDTVVLGELLGSSGSYSLTGSGQIVANQLIVGNGGGGTFTQNSLSCVSVNALQIATNPNASYTMYAGELHAGSMSIGLGTGSMGTFTQNQGLATVTGDLRIATSTANSNGTYNMTNGTLYAQNIYMGDKGAGTFNQTGGAVHVGGTLTVSNEETASSHYSLNGGVDGATVSATHLMLGELSVFDHYRGTVTLANNLTLAASSSAIYRLYDGTLTASYELIGDLNQQGTFVQTGGTNNVSNSLILGNGAWSSGVYTISGNSNLTVGHNIDISGTFNLNGGIVTADWVSLFSGSTFNSSGLPLLKVNRLWGFPANFNLNGNLIFGHTGGSSIASYSVASGGSLEVSESLMVGYNAPATFTQTGGIVSSNSLTIGGYVGGIGTYNLSNSASGLTTEEECIGQFGQGNFNQTDGDHTVNGTLHVADEPSGVGNFHLSGGSLWASKLNLAEETNTLGSFVQDGGHCILYDEMRLAKTKSSAHGIYQLVQGWLTMSGPEYIGDMGAGEFYQYGGTHHWMLVPAEMYIGYNSSATGKYAISGGNLYANSGKIFLGHNGHGTLEISGTGLVVVDELVLNTSTGTFTSTGGTLRVNKLTGFGTSPNFGCSLQIGHAGGAGQATYLIASGQSLAAHDLTVGYDAPCVLSQTGGSNTITAYMVLGNQTAGNGNYTLGTTGYVSALYERIGSHGTGTFTQNGGTSNTVGANLYLGEFTGSHGTYNFFGGNLTAHDLTAGVQGTGTVSQTAGTVAISNYLILGDLSTGHGDYTLAGTGSVSASYQRIGLNGTGTYTQNAGGNTVGNNMYIGEFAGSHGIYNLNGGSLSVGDMYVGYGDTGEFNWNGGSLSAGSVWICSHGTITSNHNWSYGKMLRIRGGTLNLTGHVFAMDSFSPAPVANGEMTDGHIIAVDAYIGSMGHATFTQSGGNFSMDDSLSIGSGPAANGQFTINGGTVTSNYQTVAYQGTGSMIHTAGTNRVFADLSLGRISGSYGTYEMNGLAATLTANNARIGHGGYGSFTHNLGNVSIAGTLSLGDESGGGSGFYYLGLGTLQANAEQIGVSGFGTFTQNNGVNNVGAGGLTLGNQAGSMGRYELNGGTLTVAGQTIIQGRGTRGDHRIVQTGGAAHYDGGLIISDQTWGGSSRYELRGGRAWVTGDLACNAQGHITLGGIMGVMAVSNNLIFSGGSLDVELGADSAISYLAVSAFGPDAVTLGNPMLTLSLDAGYTPGASAQRWLLIDPTDPDTVISGIFAGMPEGTQFNLGGRILTLSYMGGLQYNDLILIADALPAANTVWMGLGSNYWANATNWIPDTGVPDWTGTIVTFGEPGSNPNADLQSIGRTVGQIIFNNSISTTIHGSIPTPTHGGGTLTLDNNTSDVPISVSGQHAIVAPISLKSKVAITVNLMGDSLTINGTIGEAVAGVGISKLGSGLLAINDICSYTGATTISDGTLSLSSTGQIDIASSIMNNAMFQLYGGTHTLGAISGSGTMEVLSGNLSATSITQGVLNNAGTTSISNGGNIAAISGTGSLIVGGDILTVGSIVQGSLTIGSGAKLTIQPLTGGLLALRDNLKSVPEPSTLVLLGISALALSAYVWRQNKSSNQNALLRY